MSSYSGSSDNNEDLAEAQALIPQEHDRGGPLPMTPDQAAAMMAQYGSAHAAAAYSGYYGDPAAFAQGVPDGAPPPPYFYQGYPPPQGYPPVAPPQGQGFFPPQAFVYPPPFAPAPQGAQRPPRSQRRSSGSKATSPSPTNSSRKTYPSDALSEDREKVHSAIPPLGDIFSDSQPLLQNPQSIGTQQGGYGSTFSQPLQQPTPKVYNAPPRGSSRSAIPSRTAPGLPRTNSAGDFKHPLKSSSSGGTAMHSHRRINSDGPLRAMHRRLGSSDELPPTGSHRRTSSSRSRSFSGGNLKKPTHRRADSASSMRSNVSMSSVVSNISKSEFFGGVDERGRVQMHFPFEAIRLVMIDPEQPALRRGHLYLDGHVGDFEQFEEYHRLTEGINDGVLGPQWESLDKPANLCGCTCNNCNGCLGKKHLLPQPSYMLAVDDNVYKAVLGEIADAQGMPCGLFFCGHHEDVAHPSISIAVVVVTIVFALLLYVAVFTGDMP